MVTIKQVAKLAGVSPTTVSRVLNSKGNVQEEIRRKVLEAVEQLNYKPNLVGRALVTGKTNTIGLILSDLTNPFFHQLAEVIRNLSENMDLYLILGSTGGDYRKTISSAQQLVRRGVDGLIVSGAGLTLDHIRAIESLEVPTVYVEVDPSFQNISIVRSDSQLGAELAVKLLLDKGHRRIAHIAGPLDTVTARERLHGYRKIMNAFGLADESLIIPGSYRVEDGYWGLKRLLDQGNMPTAVFAANDLMAFGVLKCAAEMGISVPGQLAVIGFDDIPLSATYIPELSTVRQPVETMGEKSFHLLLDMMSGKKEAKVLELMPQIVERSTT